MASNNQPIARTVAFVFMLISSLPLVAEVQAANRLAGAVTSASTVQLKGNVHPRTSSATDVGAIANTTTLENITIRFKPTAAQEAALDVLLAEQQDSTSPNYHKWLTPEEYASQFGITESDMAKVVAWLKGQGFTVTSTSKSRSFVSFSGTASQIKATFKTQIHNYTLSGETHYANATEPSIPTALNGMVSGIGGLNSFKLKPHVKLQKRFTSSIPPGNHYISPGDFATIYGLSALYSASTPIDGSSQKIAVAGQTDVNTADVDTFRSAASLTANTPVKTLYGTNPGFISDDLGEAYLDLEWAGAVARKATLYYVYSTNVINSLAYAVDNDTAPVVSISYGACESDWATTDINWIVALGRQANSQGQTIVGPSGDSGAADCDYDVAKASSGLAVDLPAALPYVTGVGGTTFSEGSGTYWDSANGTDIVNSALTYIPEVAWNDTDSSGLAASGGGESILFSKPTWQTGTGVPSDDARCVPDVSFAASADHDGYLVCACTCPSNTKTTCTSSNCTSTCTNGFRDSDSNLTIYGGTSAGAPTFAGVVTLINQKMGATQGNINPSLYALSASNSSLFNDIVSGNNKVPCTSGSTDCGSDGYLGYSTTTGYDLVTGLGTPNAGSLVNNFSNTSATTDFSVSLAKTSQTISRSSSGTNTITVLPLEGFSGTVTLSCSVAGITGVTCSFSPSSLTPKLTYNGEAYNATASGTTSTLTITVPSTASKVRRRPDNGRIYLASGMTTFCLGSVLVIAVESRKQRWKHAVFAVICIFVLLALILAVGCGGGSGSTAASSSSSSGTATVTGTATGTITITAKSGSITHTRALALTVN